MDNFRHARHDPVPPLIDENCDKLVLGSMLSPKSAEANFYYAHPQNRFWQVMSCIFGTSPVSDTQARIDLVLSHGIALWDVIESCDIIGASDSTIKNVVYNDINRLLECHPRISTIYTTGGAAFKFLQRYNREAKNDLISNAIPLPSTSPLNCKFKLPDLIKAYSVLNERKHAK